MRLSLASMFVDFLYIHFIGKVVVIINDGKTIAVKTTTFSNYFVALKNITLATIYFDLSTKSTDANRQ